MDGPIVECACYTQARRHPEVLGRVGRTVLPFQITAAALVTGVATFAVLIVGWGVWAWILPPPFPFLTVVAVPVVAARGAQMSQIGGRNPFLAAVGVVRYACRPRSGVICGRPARPARSVRIGGGR